MLWSFGTNDLDRSTAKNDLASLALRLALAAIFVCVGYAKIRGGWGTSWQTGVDAAHTFSPGLQAVIAWCEFVAGIALFFGFLTRVAALGLIPIQIGAIWFLNFHPEFMPRVQGTEQQFFNPHPAFWPFNYAIVAMCVALLVLGGGLFSVDFWIWRRLFGRRPVQPVQTAPPLGGRLHPAPETNPPVSGGGVSV